MNQNELTEESHLQGGITNYFQGATIHNLVINGNMTHNGKEYYHSSDHPHNTDSEKTVSTEDVAAAYNECKPYVWGAASMATVFAVCRDIYHWPDNASEFERKMELMELDCPPGTITNTIRHNAYMKMHVEKWKNLGAKKRVLILAEEFQNCIEKNMDE